MLRRGIQYVFLVVLILVNTFDNPVLSQTNSLNQPEYKTDYDKAQFYLELARQYNSDALAILESDPKQSYLAFADGSTLSELLNDYNTVIHEACHGYNFELGDFGDNGWDYGYFISKEIKLLAKGREVYKSTELNKIVSKSVQDKIFRYQTYISGKGFMGDKPSSIQNGIYGLIGEFIAYYHGTKASLELFEYYLSSTSDKSDWINYLQQIGSTISSYYEFRLFIAWYISYANKKHKEDYSALMNNQNLKIAFTLNDSNFGKLIEDFKKVRIKLLTELKNLGINVEITEDDLVIYNEGSTESNFDFGDEVRSQLSVADQKKMDEMLAQMKKAGITSSMTSSTMYPLPDKQFAYLKSLLTPALKSHIDTFSIAGLTMSNYKSYMD